LKAYSADIPAVNQCVVVTQEDAGDKSLIAYLEPRPGPGPDVSDLTKRTCTESLPDYMIPSSFVVLDETFP